MAGYCSKCGAELAADSKFCNSCGASQPIGSENQNAVSSTEPENHKNENIENVVNNSKKELQEKNKDGKLYQIGGWICVVLSIFIDNPVISILFAIGAVALGYFYLQYNEKLGKSIMGAGVAIAIWNVISALFISSIFYW